MVKDLLREQRDLGKTIVMSTHQMYQVEELCDRLILIDHGKMMLYGTLEQIRQRFASHDLLVRLPGELPPAIPGVLHIESHNGTYKLVLAAGATPQSVLRSLVDLNLNLEQFEIAVPTLDEIFIRVVQGEVKG
jgi:ABC-2 type transport system ATP-binding protein